MNTKTGFVSKLPLLIQGMNAGIDDETVIQWLLETFGRANENALLLVAKKLGYTFGRMHMSLEMAQAIWGESNTNLKGQRIILRYMKCTFGTRMVVPTTGEIETEELFKNVGGYSPVSPISSSIRMQGEHIYFWNKPLLSTLSSAISTRLYSFNDGGDQADKGIDNVDLVLGGDHGQGVFRALFKVIIRRNWTGMKLWEHQTTEWE